MKEENEMAVRVPWFGLRSFLASIAAAASIGAVPAPARASDVTQEIDADSNPAADTGLPVEEVRTRQAISATRRDQLLEASGLEGRDAAPGGRAGSAAPPHAIRRVKLPLSL